VGDQWLRAISTFADGVVTVTAVAGATLYQVGYMPVFSVFTEGPSETQGASHGWSLNWEEA